MKVLTCSAVARRLQAFHDGELAVTDQIAVAAHLEWCARCAEELDDLQRVQIALRALVANRTMLSADEQATFPIAVASRMKAERALSLGVLMRSVFDDMHFVYAAGGAAAAALVCLIVAFSTFNVVMTSPGSDLNPVPIDATVLLPRPLEEIIPVTLWGDSEFALSGVVTRDGRVARLELLPPPEGQVPGPNGTIESVMGAMAQARFEPARVGGLPVAVNMVWLVSHTTVRGDAPHDPQRAGKRKNIRVAASASARVVA